MKDHFVENDNFSQQISTTHNHIIGFKIYCHKLAEYYFKPADTPITYLQGIFPSRRALFARLVYIRRFEQGIR